MEWQPLKRGKLKLPPEDQHLKETIKQHKALYKANGMKATGKQIRKRAKESIKRLLSDEIWINDLYQVNVDRKTYDNWIHLSIKRRGKETIQGSAWQHFQWIKNQLVGEEYEALELYPAESRMVNTVNQYHLWVMKHPFPEACIPCGWNEGRLIYDKSSYGSKQTLETGENK
jgi:hypothetical protein